MHLPDVSELLASLFSTIIGIMLSLVWVSTCAMILSSVVNRSQKFKSLMTGRYVIARSFALRKVISTLLSRAQWGTAQNYSFIV